MSFSTWRWRGVSCVGRSFDAPAHARDDALRERGSQVDASLQDFVDGAHELVAGGLLEEVPGRARVHGLSDECRAGVHGEQDDSRIRPQRFQAAQGVHPAQAWH